MFCVFFFKQKTAYEMRISDWSSDVCSSDLSSCKAASASAALLLASESTSGDSCWKMVSRSSATTFLRLANHWRRRRPRDRKSVVEGKSVSVRVDLGVPRIIKNNNKEIDNANTEYRTSINDTLNKIKN